jgi:hypothetical protein
MNECRQGTCERNDWILGSDAIVGSVVRVVFHDVLVLVLQFLVLVDCWSLHDPRCHPLVHRQSESDMARMDARRSGNGLSRYMEAIMVVVT